MKDVRTEVLVFRTDIVGKSDSENVKRILKDSRIKNWNIDQQDIDNVLRIESNEVSPAEVIEMVTKLGYMCEELPE
jgi:hypothetical protein